MKSTGPSPVITIAEQPGCLLVKFHGIQVAASSRALVLLEANYPPVYYVPREDIDEQYYARTDHSAIALTRAMPAISVCRCRGTKGLMRYGVTKTPRCRWSRFAVCGVLSGPGDI